eukprot:1360438-Ditylum_brightwellii.AAC.1
MSAEGPVTQAEYLDPNWEDGVLHLEDEEEAVTEIEEEVVEKEMDKEDEAVMMEVDKAKGKRANGVAGIKTTREERLKAM